MAEWDHERNIGVDPATVTYGSKKKVWWKCVVCGHKWDAKPNDRSGGHGCPECAKIKNIEKRKEKAARNNPLPDNLLKQIHSTLNEGIDLTKISKHSNQSIIWNCIFDSNHKPWPATINNRVNGSGCPECGKIKQLQSYMQTRASDNPLSEDLIKQIHPTLNEGIDLSKISNSSGQSLIWKCLVDENHKPWTSTPNDRSNGYGCPDCGLIKQVQSLKTLSAQKNPLSEDLIKEIHPTLNEGIDLSKISNSSGQSLIWKCLVDENHKPWTATVCDRSGGHGCPACSASSGEKKVAEILTEKGIIFIPEYTDPSCRNKRPLPFDFAITHNGKVIAMIEYHGAQHYIPVTFGSKKKSAEEIFKGIQHRDLIKKQWCFDNNIHFLEIPYTDFENIENIIIEFLNKL